MLQPIAVGHKSLADYTHLVGRPLVEEIRELAAELEGLKVLHLSATAFGGGVSEILYTLVPLMHDVGHRGRVAGDARARGVLQRDQAAAQRAPGQPAATSRRRSGRSTSSYNEMNAKELTGGWDVIIVHDPQPAGDPPARAGEGAAAGSGAATSTSRRRTRRRSSGSCRSSREYDDGRLPPAATTCRPGCDGTPVAHLPAGDRPAVAEEHGASRPRTPRSSATSSASTSTAR